VLEAAEEEKTDDDANSGSGKNEIAKSQIDIGRSVLAQLVSLKFRVHHAGIVAYPALDPSHRSHGRNIGIPMGCLILLLQVSSLGMCQRHGLVIDIDEARAID
jgi:hypothetical protein